MGLLSKLKVDQSGDDVVKASKEGKSREIRVTVFPSEGGRPYIVDVEADEQGHFKLGPERSVSYKVARGSVWQEGGTLRAIVNEGNTQTLHADTFTGSDVITPKQFHVVAENNMWMQLDEIGKARSPWRSATTWGIFALAIVNALLIVWLIRTVGAGFEELQAALEGVRIAGEAAGSGHQPISPGGR